MYGGICVIRTYGRHVYFVGILIQDVTVSVTDARHPRWARSLLGINQHESPCNLGRECYFSRRTILINIDKAPDPRSCTTYCCESDADACIFYHAHFECQIVGGGVVKRETSSTIQN